MCLRWVGRGYILGFIIGCVNGIVLVVKVGRSRDTGYWNARTALFYEREWVKGLRHKCCWRRLDADTRHRGTMNECRDTYWSTHLPTTSIRQIQYHLHQQHPESTRPAAPIQSPVVNPKLDPILEKLSTNTDIPLAWRQL